jgi:hypothetical protein
MNQDQYNLISACIFTLVGLVHLMRVFNDWNLIIGDWGMPRELSLFVVLLLGTMSVSGFRILLKK